MIFHWDLGFKQGYGPKFWDFGLKVELSALSFELVLSQEYGPQGLDLSLEA